MKNAKFGRVKTQDFVVPFPEKYRSFSASYGHKKAKRIFDLVKSRHLFCNELDFFSRQRQYHFCHFFLIGLVHALLVSNKQGVFLGDI